MDKIISTCCPVSSRSPRVILTLTWSGLVVGCLAKFVTGSLFVFNVYQNDLKATFNYSEQEVELQSSMMNIGLGFGLFPGLFYDRFGPTWTSGLGVLVSVTAYTLLWSTSNYVTFYSKNSWLMAIYFFLSGFGSVFTYMVALNTNIINFDPKHRSKIVGLLNAFFAGSPSIFSIIYYHVIQTGSTRTSFGDFMLMFSISFGAVDIVCMIFLRLYSPLERSESNQYLAEESAYKSTGTQELKDFSKSESNECCFDENESSSDEHLPLLKLLSNVNYWLFLGTFSFASLVGLVFLNNLTVITQSNNLSSYDQNIVLIIPITNALASAGVGVLSDIFKEKIPRMLLVILACACFTGCVVIAFIWGNSFPLLCIATFLCGFGVGVLWTLCPAVVSEMFYVGDIGRNWGIALLFASLIGWGMQEAFGAVYDHATPSGSNYCESGMSCVRGGLAMLIVSGLLSILCALILLLKRKLRTFGKCRQLQTD